MKRTVQAFVITLSIVAAVAAYAAPVRIVSMAPSITETVFFLDKGCSLVGVTTACSYPQTARNIEKIGGFGNPSLEKIAALQPTHIFTWSSRRHPVSRSLEQLGYRIRDYRAESIDEIMFMIRDLARELQVTDLTPVTRLENEVSILRRSVPPERKSVCVLFWDDPLLTVGKDSFINEILQLAGGENVFGNDSRSYFPVNPEALAVRNPSHLLLLVERHQATNILRNPFLKKLIAERRITVIDKADPELFLRAGPRVVEAVRQLRKVLHP